MLISAEKEEVLVCLEHSKGSIKPSLMDLSPDSSIGLSSDSDSVYTDVRIVPEQLKNELQQSKSNLEGEIAELKSKLRSLNEKRREALNKIIDVKGSIRVFCRVRPKFLTERRQIRESVSIGSNKIVVRSAGHKKEFGLDKVLHQEATQVDVFAEVKPILRSALDGRNVCVLAYGQTGTGKTFTMDGTDEQPGIVPRALEEIFLQASSDNSHSVTYKMSMMEIYMGNLKDLLVQRPALRSYEAAAKCNLNIQTDSKGFVEIEGLTEMPIQDFTRAKWWYNKGRRARSTSWTNVNDASSRSHCLTRITICRRGDEVGAKSEISKLWMIDLGGSERTLKTGAIGQTLDEGRAINLSLSAFGDVIAALRRKKVHVPYRNSKLTQILRDSLGNGSKVLMLVHISPYEDDVGETICSLSFTKRARGIESHRELSEELKKLREKRISELEEESRQAEEEFMNIKTQLQNAEFQLSENKKQFSTTHELSHENIEDKQNSSTENLKTPIETPKTSAKAVKTNKNCGFVPRFMAATVASRQRQNLSEKEIQEKARSLKSVTRSSSIQFSTSQSLNLSDNRSRKHIRSSMLKPHKAETPRTPKISVSESKTASLVKTKMVTSSDPNVRATISRHRRRMSSLI